MVLSKDQNLKSICDRVEPWFETRYHVAGRIQILQTV